MSKPAPAIEPETSDSDPVAPAEEQFSDEPAVEQTSPAPEPTPEPDLEPEMEEAAEAEDEPEAPVTPERSQIDAGVASILREEAERESSLRRATAVPGPVETQAEMPLEADQDPNRTRRLADLEDAEDAFVVEDLAATAAAAVSSRGELLPDIEEINSTLRATEDRSGAEDDATDVDTVVGTGRRRSRTRLGFFLVLLLAVIAVLVYLYAPQIAEAVPQAIPVLERYVEAVNSLRFWLDDLARSVAGGATGAAE